MQGRFVFLIFVFSCFLHTQTMGLSLLPFDHEQEKQRYIFRTLMSIERHPVWIYGDAEEYDLSEDEIDQHIDSAFYEQSLDPMDWWYNSPASATLKTQITLHKDTVIIDVGLMGEALLLESQVFIPAIIWKERVILNIEGARSQAKQDILRHAKTLVAHFLDEYLNSRFQKEPLPLGLSLETNRSFRSLSTTQ